MPPWRLAGTIAGLLCASLAAAPAGADPPPREAMPKPRPGGMVIVPGQEKTLEAILGGGPIAGWTMETASVEGNEVHATFRKGEVRVTLRLVHPSRASAGALPGGTVAVEGPANARSLMAKIARRARAHPLNWTKSTEAPQVRHDAGDPSGDPEGDPEDDPGTIPGLGSRRAEAASPSELLAAAEHAVQTRDYEVVETLVKRLLDHYGDAVWAQREAALLYRRMGRQEDYARAMERADALLDAAKTGGSDDAERELEAARNAIVRGEVTKARRTLDARLARADGEGACAVVAAARDLLRMDENEAALEIGRAIAGKAPSCAEAYLVVAEAGRRLRRSEEVLPLLKTGAERLPDDSAVVTQYADTLKNLGRRDEAIAVFEDLVAKGHHDPSLLGSLLGIYTRQGVTRALAETWKKKADADPSDYISAFFTGVLLHYRGEYEASNRYLTRARQVLQTEPRVFIYLAMNHFHLGEQAKARRLIERAIRLGHADPDVYYCRAEIVIDKDPDLAIRDMERYLALTEGRIDVFEPKQQKVAKKLERLRACRGARVPSECVAAAERTQWVLYGGVGAAVVLVAAVGLFLRRRKGA